MKKLIPMGNNMGKRKILLFIAMISFLLLSIDTSEAITISTNYIGGDVPDFVYKLCANTSTNQYTVEQIPSSLFSMPSNTSSINTVLAPAAFTWAADVWEAAIRDDFHFTINWEWSSDLDIKTLARATIDNNFGVGSATIFLNNQVNNFYFDTSNPHTRSMGYGSLSAHYLSNGISDWGYLYNPITFEHDNWVYDYSNLSETIDFYSIVLHELGHALGMGTNQTMTNAFPLDILADILSLSDLAIEITEPRPMAGTEIPIVGLDSPHIDMYWVLMDEGYGGGRDLLTGIDILAIAELNKFTDLYFPEYHSIEFNGLPFVEYSWNKIPVEPIPEPATILLLGTGLIGLAGFRKRFRKR